MLKKNIILALSLIFSLSIFSQCLAGDQLPLAEQNAKAKAIFIKLQQTPNEDLDAFHKGYREVIEQYPDTEYAEIACWRLSNLLLMGYEPPRTKETVQLLEHFLRQYPNSQGVPQVKQRLVRLYEETGQSCKAAELYAEVVPAIPEPPGDQGLATWALYADALKQCGKKAEAKVWYQKVLKYADKGSISEMAAKAGLEE